MSLTHILFDFFGAVIGYSALYRLTFCMNLIYPPEQVAYRQISNCAGKFTFLCQDRKKGCDYGR
jgi:hypothetical protein